MAYIFRTLAAIFSVYNLLCFIRIFMTWIPQASYSKAAQILAKICDPYLQLFRGIKWLHFGSFDFGPAVGLCILGAVSSVFQSLANGRNFTLGTIFALILQIFWSLFSTFITFFLIIFFVRWIIIIIKKTVYTQNVFLDNIDRAISPIVYKIANFFSFGKVPNYKNSLLISIIAAFILLIVGNILIAIILSLFLRF